MNLVTGGTGIVGSHIIVDLLRQNLPVAAIKRATSNSNIVKELLKETNELSLFENIKWFDGDLLNTNSLLDAMKGVNRIFHCAAFVSFDPKDKAEMFKTNIEGTANIVNCAIQSGVKELLYTSSTAAIGKQKKGQVITEKLTWDAGAKNSYYSLTKYFAELEVWRGQEEGLQVGVVNPGVIIGPGEWGKSSTNIFTTMWKGLKFYSKGANGFVDARDVSKALITMAQKSHFGERYLLISENLSFKHFFELVADSINKSAPSIATSAFASKIAWRLSWVWSRLSGQRALITKETARSAIAIQEYSNQKIKTDLQFEFIPVAKAVQRTGKLFLESRVRG